ncbi:hypothetical protein TNCV_3472161 [Trichonephila clavipes]|nr:hypothetical protein TNCV_3472161 [Trichonephila clavipes]
MGGGGLMMVKGTEQQKFFLELGAMSLETLPEFNDIYDGFFPNSLHEKVHEDVSYCTMARRMTCITQSWRTSFKTGKLKWGNSKGPSVKWGKGATQRGQVRNEQTSNIKWGGEMGKLQISSNEEWRNGETAQAFKGNRSSMQRKQHKHAMESDQACNGIRPSMQ